jgi:hypothetical protein
MKDDIELEKRLKVDPVAVKAYNEAQQWTAILKDGNTITGTLAELRAYGKASKQEPNPIKPGADKQLG